MEIVVVIILLAAIAALPKDKRDWLTKDDSDPFE